MTKVHDIVVYLQDLYPLFLASNFDTGKVGLQFGSHNKSVKKVMIALDGSTDVIEEALEKKVDLLITHHPFMFSSIINMNYDNPLTKRIKLVIQNELNVFSMHTNFDVSIGGMNDILLNILEAEPIQEVVEAKNDDFLRIGKVNPIKFDDFIEHVKTKFKVSHVRVVGKLDKTVKTIGIVGGSGGSELYKAKILGCDVLVTGEIKHNQALDAKDLGIQLIEVSHAVERLFKETVKEKLEKEFSEVEFILSEKDYDLFIDK